MSNRPAPSPPPVTSLDRALAILEVLAEAGPQGLQLNEIAAQTDINMGSAHRLLKGLAHRGYARRDEASNYTLGDAPRRLAQAFSQGDSLAALFHPLLLEISRSTEELVHLGAPDGRRIVYLDKIEPERSVRVWSRIGRRVHIATTALGRALVAAVPPNETLMDGYVREADPSHDQPDLNERFHAAVAAARSLGYAVENQENEPGIACVGIALRSPVEGDAAISVTGPAERMTPRRLAEVGEMMRHLSAELAPRGFSLSAIGDASAGNIPGAPVR